MIVWLRAHLMLMCRWPLCDCLIAFYSHGFPLEKAEQYAKLRKPYLLNQLESQHVLHDRRKVYAKLEECGIPTPQYMVVNRDEHDKEIGVFIEDEDWIELNGRRMNKPFVEKPVDGDNHSVMIYYPSSAGSGMKELFRKVGNRASKFHPHARRVRRTGSYIYEEFMPTGGTDVKVYTVGPDYAHAEARKSPALDGVVQRSPDGKEIRYPVLLTPAEKAIGREVCTAFGQAVCGFDLLRSNGRSYVCDVNGWSFVKNSYKYYDDAACVLRSMLLEQLAPHLYAGPLETLPWSKGDMSPKRANSAHGGTFGSVEELRAVVAVIRHGDRTPKEKLKMRVTQDRLLSLMLKYNGGKPRTEAKLKSAVQLQDLLDATRMLVPRVRNGKESDSEAEDLEHAEKLRHVKAVLEEGGHFSGIYRKVQLKPIRWKSEESQDGESSETESGEPAEALLVLKYGGVLTHAGHKQAETLGRDFRNNMYPGEGTGLLRLHSTYRHDLKIYSSDEGRVQMSAAAFTKGLLDLEGELTPILVSLVSKDSPMLDGLDTASVEMEEAKARLNEVMTQDGPPPAKPLEGEDRPWMVECGGISANTLSKLRRVVVLMKDLTFQLKKLCKDEEERQIATEQLTEEQWTSHEAQALGKKNMEVDRIAAGLPCGSEGFLLMHARWKKLERDFFNERKDRFNISKVPDIYDSAKYDVIHNDHLELEGLHELYVISKELADGVVPNEYGLNPRQKLKIGSKIARRLLGKILIDLMNTKDEAINVVQLMSNLSRGLSPNGKHSGSNLSHVKHVHTNGASASHANEKSRSQTSGSSSPQGKSSRSQANGDVDINPAILNVRNSVFEYINSHNNGNSSSSTSDGMPAILGTSSRPDGPRRDSKSSEISRGNCSEAEEDESDKEAQYRLDPKYANVRTPERHVRTRLYFTSESHMHALINVLRYCQLDESLAGEHALVSDDALLRLHQTTELDYLTHIVVRMYENIEVPISDSRRFRVELLYSTGASFNPLEVSPRGRDHTLPVQPTMLLQKEGSELSLETLEKMLKPFAMPAEDFPPASTPMSYASLFSKVRECMLVEYPGRSPVSDTSTTPYTKEQEESVAAILKERKEKEAKKQTLLEAQAAKKKKLEEEMEKLKKEEEEKLKEVEEEEEEEEIPLVRTVRRKERGESSGVSEDERKLEKMVSEWVANLSLGEDEEALMYIPQAERDVGVAEIKALTGPLEQQTRRRRIAAATELEKELAAAAEQHTNALTQGGLQSKVDAIAKGIDVLIRVQQEQMHTSKGHDIALQSIRVGFRDFAHDMMMRMGSEMQARVKNTEQFCVGTIEGTKIAVPKEEEARPRRERGKVKFLDAYNRRQGEDFDNWEANINSYMHLQDIIPEEQVLVAFHALRDEASSFARSLARTTKCDNDMVAYSTITPLNEFLKFLHERFADVTKGIKASDKFQTIHTRQWKSARTLKGAMDELVAVPNHGLTEPQLVQLFYCAMPESLHKHFYDKSREQGMTYDKLSRDVVAYEAQIHDGHCLLAQRF
ncbi:hypothetical protein CBR_g24415 [Chara braunii]|uniref:Inositol hexakisphosphate and diphosphoinositol-pentakisphosphate kinase n=1 Tax=Chara braunii TaxID=69332 RepID=A0A388JMR7_CHABU|nr:hypothetical protein CBR_g24415 [Chara braunii]|eukprot:GBG59071.1 hypothetical protein CBR_g24415 [Chara braunii]